MRTIVSKLGRRLVWPAALLTLGAGICLIGRGTPTDSPSAASAPVGITQSGALPVGLQTTRYSNVTVRYEPSADGNSRLKTGAGWIYGKPGSVAPKSSYSGTVTQRRGQSVAGGFYVTMPPNRFPRAEAKAVRGGKAVVTCVEPSGVRHNHKAGEKHTSLR